MAKSVVFAYDCVVCRTLSQLCSCISVACVSTWCEVSVNVRFVLRGPCAVDGMLKSKHELSNWCPFQRGCERSLSHPPFLGWPLAVGDFAGALPGSFSSTASSGGSAGLDRMSSSTSWSVLS